MTAPTIPSWRELGQAVAVAVYVCAMTFFGGLIAESGAIEPHFADWKLAAGSGISAGLAFLGWTVKSAGGGPR